MCQQAVAFTRADDTKTKNIANLVLAFAGDDVLELHSQRQQPPTVMAN